MEVPLLILLFFGVIAITAILFVCWTLFSILAWMFRGVRAAVAPQPRRKIAAPIVCHQSGCQLSNPADARFCRRCGQALQSGLPAFKPRVALG